MISCLSYCEQESYANNDTDVSLQNLRATTPSDDCDSV